MKSLSTLSLCAFIAGVYSDLLSRIQWTTVYIERNNVRIQTGVYQSGNPNNNIPPHVVGLNVGLLTAADELTVRNGWNASSNVNRLIFCGRTLRLNLDTKLTLGFDGASEAEFPIHQMRYNGHAVYISGWTRWNSPLGYYFFPDIQTNGNVHVHIRNDFKLRVDDVENVPFAIETGDLLFESVGVTGFLTNIIYNDNNKTAVFEPALHMLSN